ncbi:hypothetical protein CAPTEDRAFT_139301, partial [Capitella teleta]
MVQTNIILRCRDLSGSSIQHLPTKGLSMLEKLFLEDIWSLKVFPFVLDFFYVKEASLTYPHHCCAFHHPELQYPAIFHEFQKMISESCGSDMMTPMPEDQTWSRSRRSLDSFSDPAVAWIKQVACTPRPDCFNPCEDVMGYMWLRVVVWFVVITALMGNLIVLIVTIGSWRASTFTVAKFLMCNLAFADLLISVYLLMLASFDLHTMGVYFTRAIPWQYGGWCQTAGFLAIFATCLSTFTLTVITMERWYAISYAIHLTKRLRLRLACKILLLGWVFALIMAFLPILGVSSYSKTSICLPMEASSAMDKAYVLMLLVINALAFCLICFCYVDMFRQVRGDSSETNTASHNDLTIAKKMSILVFTDFLCLFPIAFFGLTAAAGNSFIDVTESKILLVFFFPLNSCANPFLYAIITKQFKKDVYAMFNKCRICRRATKKYRMSHSS